MAATHGAWQAARHPAAALAVLLPLLVAYEGTMSLLTATGQAAPRAGLDAWLAYGLTRINCLCPWLPTVGLGVMLLCWCGLRWPGPLPAWRSAVGSIVVESGIYAAMLVALAVAQQPLFDHFHLSLAGPQPVWPQLLGLAAAGVYEEAVFRLGMFAVLARAFGLILPQWCAWPMAGILSAGAFAAAHHAGPYGEALQDRVFLFRLLAGGYFAVLLKTRGFGITATTHAIYNLLASLW